MILEEIESPINGHLTVVRDLAWGKHIMAGGLTQSGGIAKSIWQSALKRLKEKEIKSCLILGLGGGSIAGLARKLWKEAEITGVEIDPIMVELGVKHLGLNSTGVQIKIQDAFDFCESTENKYDLVCVDTYCGDNFPQKFEDEKFLKIIKSILTENGTAIFNRLYYDEKRPLAIKFLNKLEKVFSRVEVVYPQANVMFLCYKT